MAECSQIKRLGFRALWLVWKNVWKNAERTEPKLVSGRCLHTRAARGAMTISQLFVLAPVLGLFSIQEKVIFNTRYHYISSYLLIVSLCIMCIIILYLIYHVPRRHACIIFFPSSCYIM